MIAFLWRHYRAALLSGAVLVFASSSRGQTFDQVNLVTDNQAANPAAIEDPNLVNAWGMSYSPTSPFWVSDNGSGHATLYRVDPLTDVPTILGLTVSIPGAGTPTGQAFSGVAGAFNGNAFLFGSEDGTISGWRGALGTSAETLQTGSSANVYKGIALGSAANNSYLYAANFRAGTIDILKGSAGAPDLTGHFVDPTLPSGFAPFNIRNLGGTLYVTYAMQDAAKHDDVAGLGNGFVDAYDLQGNFLRRIGSQGKLNSPWGIEIAPSSFGPLAGDLLVGNFGDGTINAFDLTGNTFIGQVSGRDGNPLSIDGLWGLSVGNGGGAGSSDKLYFTAGPDDESHGLFGLVASVPEVSSSLSLLAMGMSACLLFARKVNG
jgi:uncharacterized protein (TIGR03118 family)